jgi:hypothetical protein
LYSETRRSTSARLRRRIPAPTPFASMPQLQHRSKDNGRMGVARMHTVERPNPTGSVSMTSPQLCTLSLASAFSQRTAPF